ncbi:ABC transporter inner membrane protein [Thermoclostridium stercorarium subsp. stercorarium DSM 8532]|jgi:multiple sugar transport system permease protein|uniref:ABC transporter inner membrane protein n=3 Tax=Thermoclostridium stercorarium TaxID=1510 RepID=L7VGY9_THES1|nr:sugar ABC transporter permease [Thermoclostridium stercorarium]AGC67245.1 ABC transporter inner membrane protein [Thermoclostridium stercorarium subsp. stercorarium DSM 8532]AGI38316.1 ABC transporter permease subunit [Thermoclostridium stercorarium subsp. stercorarium DSM 8532]ANW97752.1 ABC transporter permease [Thermoclostridium stercorarium subsp. thermolacticum DSM 2910]ANX00278.1 ABC transporter permease [Thermoclostridium stercorarium subsp. leptospartum DSM 9219]
MDAKAAEMLRKSQKKRNIKKNLIAYSFIAPNFIGFAVFTLVPMMFAFLLAFLEWDGNNPIKFVGLENFKALVKDKFFLASLKNTIIYSIGTVPLTLVTSLLLAVVLNQNIKGRAFFRTLGFFPYVASLVAVTSVWTMVFHASKGPVNAILYYVFKIPKEKLPNWFAGNLVLLMLILFSVWRFMGYYMVMFLAGLQTIPKELYEAGTIDGANAWQRFRYITLPALKPTTFLVTVMLTINCFKIYDIAIMLAGGSQNTLSVSAMVLVYYIYQNAFNFWKLGYSSAVAMVLFVLVFSVTLIQFKIQENYANE